MLAGMGILAGLVYSCQKEIQDEQEQILKGAKIDVVLTPLEQLGKSIFFDKISEPGNMACADCHAPSVGFTGPNPGINLHGSVYRGAVATRFGDRRPPSAAYATFSPILHYDAVEEVFAGGNFWDGRATGERLGNPSAEQALGPFLNPVEQNNPDVLTVLKKIASAKYAYLWTLAFPVEPIDLLTPDGIIKSYDNVGFAIAAYEKSAEVNQFSSKFDSYLKGQVSLTAEEAKGLELFEGDGKCALCHTSEGEKPLFTDFTFDNLGVPKNPENPVYKSNPGFIDQGLGGFLLYSGNPAWSALADANIGKHKVPTLRNVDKRPGNGFTKSYMHNGVFKSLKEVVHFYNTRDVGTWPVAEVSVNINEDELGNLLLTDTEENAIVAFMKTLSDGYTFPKK